MVIDEDFEAARAFVNSAERAFDDTETVDALLDGRVLLRQPKEGYRVAIDPVLLAASIEAGAGERVLDVGAGVGAAALCLASRCEGAELYGLELQPELVELARSNAAESGPQGRFSPRGFARSARPNCSRRVYSRYGKSALLAAGTRRSEDGPAKAKSHIEGDARLSHWIDFVLGMASPNGTVTMIHRADRLDEILASLHGRAGEIVVFPICRGWRCRQNALSHAKVGAARLCG